MLWQVYLKNGTAYVPTVAQTDAGFYVDVDPVRIVSVLDTEAVQRAVRETIGRGNPKIPTPKPDAFLRSAVLKYANVQSWSDFEKDASCWKIVENGGSYRIKLQRHGCSSLLDNPRKVESLPAGIDIDEVARTVVGLIQSVSLPTITETTSLPSPEVSLPESAQPTYFELTEEAVVAESTEN